MRYSWALAISLALMTSTVISGCSGTKKEEIIKTDKPTPYAAGNYPGTLKIGTPYDIDGRTYVPNHDPDYIEEGMASWYGPGFHGRSTANGERFDQHAMTAAHRTLPMPSMVRVTNLENGKTVELKVNDRGPFKKDRIIDLSKAAAEELGVIGKGTALVRVEYLPHQTKLLIADLIKNNQIKATKDTLTILAMNDVSEAQFVSDAAPPAASIGLISNANAAEPTKNGVSDYASLTPVASRSLEAPSYNQEMVVASTTHGASSSGIFIQAGSFSHARNAQEFSDRLAPIGETVVKPVEISGRTWYRVQVGPLANMSIAYSALQNLEGMGIQNAHVIKD